MKKFEWEKLGLIFKPNSDLWWSYTHAQVPTVDILTKDIIRVYYAGRTKKQRSHIGYVEFEIKDKSIKKIFETNEPVLKPGNIGYFDEHGVYPASIIDINNKKFLYYIGWNQGVKEPLFYASIGLAISDDGGITFKKYSKAPILQRSEYDPCLVTAPNVISLKNDKFYMSYVSGTEWIEEDNKLKSKYHIKSAWSQDGINWVRKGEIAIDFKDEKETNIARSNVVKYENKYLMWFCNVYDNKPYRISYAESFNCKLWERKNTNGLDVTRDSFDNEMVCYPNVFFLNEKLYMIYNGNSYGKEGFGIAIAKIK